MVDSSSVLHSAFVFSYVKSNVSRGWQIVAEIMGPLSMRKNRNTTSIFVLLIVLFVLNGWNSLNASADNTRKVRTFNCRIFLSFQTVLNSTWSHVTDSHSYMREKQHNNLELVTDVHISLMTQPQLTRLRIKEHRKTKFTPKKKIPNKHSYFLNKNSSANIYLIYKKGLQ